MKPREFWLQKSDLEFDLNWRKIFAAEYPHKDTTGENALRVIEYSAYDQLYDGLQKEAFKNRDLQEQNKIMREALEEISKVIVRPISRTDAEWRLGKIEYACDTALARCDAGDCEGTSK